jgi:CheY-like chemotaxis protein
MTTGSEGYGTRSALELLQDQLDGVAAWQIAARAREQAENARRENREVRTEARRRLEALRRTNEALLARSDAAVMESVNILSTATPRAVVVHRQDWMREKLSIGLTEQGLTVVAQAQDGADALGISIAEQPDLLVVEDRLPSVRTVEILRTLKLFAPRTVIAAQVEHDSGVGDMLEAGAAAVFHRRVPPAVLCDQIVRYLRNRPRDVLLLT